MVLKKEGNVQKVAGLAEQSPDMGKLREHDKEGGKWVEEMKGRSKGNKGREISGVGGGGTSMQWQNGGKTNQELHKEWRIFKRGPERWKKTRLTTHEYSLSATTEVNQEVEKQTNSFSTGLTC